MSSEKYIVAFSAAESAICGLPPTVELTETQARSMARIHLGGLSAIRTPTFRAGCNTVQSLIDKGLLNERGLTDLGARVAASLAADGVV